MGWSAELPTISRSTSRRLPIYDDAHDLDIFQLTGFEDLVPAMRMKHDGTVERDADTIGPFRVVRYRPRTEGAFARIERIQKSGEVGSYWRVMPGDGTVTIYGRTQVARIADPDDPARIFRWLPEWTFDDRGNCFEVVYKAEDLAGVPHTPSEELRLSGGTKIANRHLKRIFYGNRAPYPWPTDAQAYDPPPPSVDFYFFEAVIDYGDHDLAVPTPDEAHPWVCRGDPFSNARPGFDIRTYRLARRALFFNRFDEFAAPHTPAPWVLVRALEFEYARCDFSGPSTASNEADLLVRIHEVGYRPDGAGGYDRRRCRPPP